MRVFATPSMVYRYGDTRSPMPRIIRVLPSTKRGPGTTVRKVGSSETGLIEMRVADSFEADATCPLSSPSVS